MFQRLKDAIDAGKVAVADAENAGAGPKPYTALLVLDELGPAAQPTRERFFKAARASDHVYLLILGPDSELEHPDLGVTCEFIPRLADITAGTGQRPDNVQLYRLARLRLILEKWNVAECRWIGPEAGELVELWAEQSVDQPEVQFLPAD